MIKSFKCFCITLIKLIVFHSLTAQSVTNFDLANLRNQDPLLTKAYDNILIQQAWEHVIHSLPATTQLSNVRIGIIDTGIDPSHPEFNVPAVDLGIISRSILNDFEVGGHGTQVAGIIGANNLSRTSPLPTNSPHMNGILSGVLDESQYVLETRPAIGTLISARVRAVGLSIVMVIDN